MPGKSYIAIDLTSFNASVECIDLVPHESLIIMEDGTRIKVEDVVEARHSTINLY